MAFTESWLKANHSKARTKSLVKSDRDGVCVRVSPKGKITDSLRYYYNGKQTTADIGTYPLMTLKEARTENQRLRKKLEQRHDPKVVRQLERQAMIAAKSLEGLFDLWYESYCIKNKKGHFEIRRSFFEIRRSFEIHVFGKGGFGHLLADKVSLHTWLELLERLAETTPAIAERILVNAKQMLKFAVKRKLIPANPRTL